MQSGAQESNAHFGNVPCLRAQEFSLQTLRSDSLSPPILQFKKSVPVFVSAKLPIPAEYARDPVVRALGYLNRYRALYGLQAPREELFLSRIVSDGFGGHSVFFGQHQNGVPVFSAELAVYLSENEIVGTGGEYLAEIPDFPSPRIDRAGARQIAMAEWQVDVSALRGEPALMFFDADLFSDGDTPTYLTWSLQVDDALGSRTVFIDASTGEVLSSLSNTPDGDRRGEDFDIETVNNATESNSCWITTSDDDQWFDEDGRVSGARPDAEGNNVYQFTHDVYHYYRDNYGMLSYDDDEEDIEIYLDVRFNRGPNARYNGQCDIFEFWDGWGTKDVVAHEITHGVTATSSELVYVNQSGALNESYSDVFAALIDPGDWFMGEDLPNRTNGVDDDGDGTVDEADEAALRDLSNPPRYGDPDHMLATVSGDGVGLRPATASPNQGNDWGGVHINSGIPNKAAYLLIQGDVHNGIVVDALGPNKVGQLYLEVLRRRLTKNSTFLAARNATVAAAQAFVDGGRHGFTSSDVCSVMNAFASVGLGASDIDCDGNPDDVDPDDDADGASDLLDVCPITFDPGQTDTDGDGLGDACDPDDDADGILDDGDGSGVEGDAPCTGGATASCDDNARLVANPFQQDDDNDGIGNVVDDDDGDGIFNPVDNCRFVSNRDRRIRMAMGRATPAIAMTTTMPFRTRPTIVRS